MAPVVATLDPAEFRRPRTKCATRHIYLANCGRSRGDTPEAVLEVLHAVAPDAEAEGLHLGDEGVSYLSFASPSQAVAVRDGLAAAAAQQAADNSDLQSDPIVAAAKRWIVKFAERAETVRGPRLPASVASTAHVEVPGVQVIPDFVSESDAVELLAAIDTRPWDTTIKRRVQHYGHAFDYARLTLGVDPQEGLPDFCADVVRRLTDWLPHPVNQLTINEYQPGVGIASHVDAHSAFEDGVAIVTLGSGIVMELRRPHLGNGGGKISVGKHHRLAPPPPQNDDEEAVLQKNIWLPANSLLVMRDEARYAWQHGIAWRKTDCIADGQAVHRGRRVSLTLRTARGRPCNCRWPTMCDAQNPEAHVLPSRVGVAAAQFPSAVEKVEGTLLSVQ